MKPKIGPKLKILFKARGMTQQSIANECEISRIAVFRFFKGETQLKAYDFTKVLKLLDMDVEGKIDWLLKEELRINEKV
jgi:transcriptional regulator with XRE-family HTH domain